MGAVAVESTKCVEPDGACSVFFTVPLPASSESIVNFQSFTQLSAESESLVAKSRNLVEKILAENKGELLTIRLN